MIQPSTFSLTSNLMPIGVGVPHNCAYPKLIFSEAITKLFDDCAQIYAEMKNREKQLRLCKIEEDDEVEDFPDLVKEELSFQKRLDFLFIDIRFERLKVDERVNKIKEEILQKSKLIDGLTKKCKALEIVCNEELTQGGAPSSFYQNNVKKLEKRYQVIRHYAKYIADMEGQLFVLKKQRDLLSQVQCVDLVTEEVYQALPKRVPIQVINSVIGRSRLQISIEPPDIQCQYVLVGKKNCKDNVFELCAIPGRSLQNPTNLIFDIDREELFENGVHGPVKIMILNKAGVLQKFEETPENF